VDGPSLLVSFWYLKSFQRNRSRFVFRDWVMDSGAFSAMQAGKSIDLDAYNAACKELLALDPQLKEVFGLDVIKGDWRQSRRNYEKSWSAGIPVIPCWHRGEPWDVLVGYAKDYPKIAIGGLVGTGTTAAQKRHAIGQAFARVWPKPIHGFGLMADDLILDFPFHSVDATNWALAPRKFGSWREYGTIRVGTKVTIRSQVEYYLKLEQQARRRWQREMTALNFGDAPNLRLVSTGQEFNYQ